MCFLARGVSCSLSHYHCRINFSGLKQDTVPNKVTIIVCFDMCGTWEKKAAFIQPRGTEQVRNFSYGHLDLITS